MSDPDPIQPGAKAPAFTFPLADGSIQSTESLKGSPYLVYFYPKDDTPGCTKEACAFRDGYAEFQAAGLTVIGVSADDEASHGKFRQKYQLPFALVSDPDRVVIDGYGVWGSKQFMGKVYDGIHRMSFLIGPDGTVAKTYPKVKPEEHAGEVLADVNALFSH